MEIKRLDEILNGIKEGEYDANELGDILYDVIIELIEYKEKDGE